MQDGVDLITALAMHPETARRLARKFWNFFISEIYAPDPSFVESRGAGLSAERDRDQAGRALHPHVALVQRSRRCASHATRGRRNSSSRAIKEVGWQNFSLDKARSPMAAMGQQLFEPPNVGGWPLGANWFSTGTMLARTNFAATLAGKPEGFLAAHAASRRGASPQGLLAAMLDRVTPAPLDRGAAAGADVVPRRRRARGPAAPSNSTRGPRAWRVSSSAPPSISWFRRRLTCAYLDDSSSVTASRRSRSGSPRHRF